MTFLEGLASAVSNMGQGFDWSIPLFGATFLLAVFTALMARATYRSVSESTRLASTAELDMQQRIQPYLVPKVVELMSPSTPPMFSVFGLTTQQDPPPIHCCKCWYEDHTGWVAIRMQNIGLGPAVIADPNTAMKIDLNGKGVLFGSATDLAIASGSQAFVAFAGQPNSPAASFNLRSHVELDEPFTISVQYSDMRDQQCFETTVLLDGRRPEPGITTFSVRPLAEVRPASESACRRRFSRRSRNPEASSKDAPPLTTPIRVVAADDVEPEQ